MLMVTMADQEVDSTSSISGKHGAAFAGRW
jgi:hypothetical protein